MGLFPLFWKHLSLPRYFGGICLICVNNSVDISFPASTLILSNIFPRQHQGIAASLINTTVNYSISIGLGIASTVESRVNDGGRQLEKGYRSALWTSVGLSALGLIVAVAYAMSMEIRKK